MPRPKRTNAKIDIYAKRLDKVLGPKRVRMWLAKGKHSGRFYLCSTYATGNYAYGAMLADDFKPHLKLKPGQSREVWVDIRFVKER